MNLEDQSQAGKGKHPPMWRSALQTLLRGQGTQDHQTGPEGDLFPVFCDTLSCPVHETLHDFSSIKQDGF